MLRWLFFILLMCNLALFAWGYRQVPPQTDTPTPLPADLPGIPLVGESSDNVEAGSDERVAAPEEPAASQPVESITPKPDSTTDSGPLDADAAVTKCVRLGPMEQEERAFEVITVLNDNGHRAELRVSNEKERSGYWVLIAPNGEDPDFVIANLQLAGISDVWRFTKGDLAGMISLGLYSSRDDAETRRRQLADKTFAAEIRPRLIDKYTYWVNTAYDAQAEQAVAALDKTFHENPWLEFPPSACQDIASSTENP